MIFQALMLIVEDGMACATCHVYVEEKWLNKIPKAEEAEVDMIGYGIRTKKKQQT